MSPDWVQMMARYNAWQNHNIVGAADTLTDAARELDRAAFFGSIFGTLNHNLWGDLSWMAYIEGGNGPECAISDSGSLHSHWTAYKAARLSMDRRFLDWAGGLSDADTKGDISWQWQKGGAINTHPRQLVFTNLFTHQIQHRGQVHAMLTAAGAKPGGTDLFFMPPEGPWL